MSDALNALIYGLRDVVTGVGATLLNRRSKIWLRTGFLVVDDPDNARMIADVNGAELPDDIAAGDLFFYDGAELVRIPIGTAGQVLTVNATEDGYEWTDGGAVVGPFAPQDDASCICWFDTETGVVLSGSDVTQWTDQSGNGCHATVPGGATAPTYTASNATYNNKGSIDFGNIAMALRATIPATEPAIVYAVGHDGYNGTTVTNCYWWDFANAGNKKILDDALSQAGVGIFDGAFVLAGTTRLNAASVVAASFDAAGDDKLYINDPATAAASGAAGNTAAGTSLTIGQYGNYGAPSPFSLRGSLVAFGVFNATTHDATKRTEFFDGLKARYGL